MSSSVFLLTAAFLAIVRKMAVQAQLPVKQSFGLTLAGTFKVGTATETIISVLCILPIMLRLRVV